MNDKKREKKHLNYLTIEPPDWRKRDDREIREEKKKEEKNYEPRIIRSHVLIKNSAPLTTCSLIEGRTLMGNKEIKRRKIKSIINNRRRWLRSNVLITPLTSIPN